MKIILAIIFLPFFIAYEAIKLFFKTIWWVIEAINRKDTIVINENHFAEEQIRESFNPTSASISGSIQQILETLEIMDKSKNVDIIVSRGKFLNERLNFIKDNCQNSNYLFDLQRGVENYKDMYYDNIPKERHLYCITKPHEFDFIDYYSQSVFNAYKKYTYEQLEQIVHLKRKNAIFKRKEKLIDLTAIVRIEILPCVSYKTIHQEIDRIYKIILTIH